MRGIRGRPSLGRHLPRHLAERRTAGTVPSRCWEWNMLKRSGVSSRWWENRGDARRWKHYSAKPEVVAPVSSPRNFWRQLAPIGHFRGKRGRRRKKASGARNRGRKRNRGKSRGRWSGRNARIRAISPWESSFSDSGNGGWGVSRSWREKRGIWWRNGRCRLVPC